MTHFVNYLNLTFDKNSIIAFRVMPDVIEFYFDGKETPVHIGYTAPQADVEKELICLFMR